MSSQVTHLTLGDLSTATEEQKEKLKQDLIDYMMSIGLVSDESKALFETFYTQALASYNLYPYNPETKLSSYVMSFYLKTLASQPKVLSHVCQSFSTKYETRKPLTVNANSAEVNDSFESDADYKTIDDHNGIHAKKTPF